MNGTFVKVHSDRVLCQMFFRKLLPKRFQTDQVCCRLNIVHASKMNKFIGWKATGRCFDFLVHFYHSLVKLSRLRSNVHNTTLEIDFLIVQKSILFIKILLFKLLVVFWLSLMFKLRIIDATILLSFEKWNLFTLMLFISGFCYKYLWIFTKDHGIVL